MTGTRHILLVDGHAAVRQGLAQVLTEAGIGECREAAGREEALAAADRGCSSLTAYGKMTRMAKRSDKRRWNGKMRGDPARYWVHGFRG